MRAAIYLLRDRGVRLPRPKEPREGNLVMAVSERGDRRFLKAQLLENGRDLLPPLLKAQVTRITRNGLVLKGIELTSRVPGSIKATVTSHPQTWWVLVHTTELAEMYEDHDPLDEIAAEAMARETLFPAGQERFIRSQAKSDDERAAQEGKGGRKVLSGL